MVVTVLVSTHSANSICTLVVRRATALSELVQLLADIPSDIVKSVLGATSCPIDVEKSPDAGGGGGEEDPVKSGCVRALKFDEDAVRRREEGREGGSILRSSLISLLQKWLPLGRLWEICPSLSS